MTLKSKHYLVTSKKGKKENNNSENKNNEFLKILQKKKAMFDKKENTYVQNELMMEIYRIYNVPLFEVSEE